jgi:hypothetical protein
LRTCRGSQDIEEKHTARRFRWHSVCSTNSTASGPEQPVARQYTQFLGRCLFQRSDRVYTTRQLGFLPLRSRADAQAAALHKQLMVLRIETLPQ